MQLLVSRRDPESSLSSIQFIDSIEEEEEEEEEEEDDDDDDDDDDEAEFKPFWLLE